MMNCLYCGKLLSENATDHEKAHRWHSRCIRKFFGTSEMPTIKITDRELQALVNETVNRGLTVTGVQKKLSLHLSKGPDARLTIVDYPTGYILKPQTEEYKMMPEFENMAMRMATAAGIQTVDNALIYNNGMYSYITRRADRLKDGGMLAMEDFCQLAGRLTIDKYKGSYERCAKIVEQYSCRRGLDMSELFMRVVFSFIIGNSDMHLKNFSMMEIKPGAREYILSPAYDMLPVNIVLPEDDEQMALTLNGKRSRLRRSDFVALSEKCGISKVASEKMIDRLCGMHVKFDEECDKSYLTDELKDKTKRLIADRIKILTD